jgi:transaldolase/glucose-6-phosphate isomerase
VKIRRAGSVDITDTTRRWTDQRLMQRLWTKDHTVWSVEPQPEISDRLGWLTLPETAARHLEDIDRLATEAVAEGIRYIALCGMGGSSLAPEVFGHDLPRASGYPQLVVVDSTHPDAVAAITERIDLDRTWFVIASKSGGTLETMSFMRWFWAAVSETTTDPGSQFIAITDPDSSLDTEAKRRGFKAVFHADAEVGGRYSALSAFGLVPAGLIGVDVASLLAEGRAAAAMCGPQTPLAVNPGFVIGATMASAAAEGRDKVRFIGSGYGDRFGAWAEQLIAESTGKDGRGIVPVDGGPARSIATDEITIAVGVDPGETDVAITLVDPADLAAAMFVLEMATAVAGAELGIHPFNQPDVQRAKTLASEAMSADQDAAANRIDIRTPTVGGIVASKIDAPEISYIAVHAYIAPTSATDEALHRLRQVMTTRTGLATTVGYGPRFLHSTGQIHKGGPPGGVFVQLVDTPSAEIAVPETDFTFNRLIEAQAVGDLAALDHVGRSTVSIDLGANPVAGIVGLGHALAGAIR